MRSRMVIRPARCCLSIRSSPPSSRATLRRLRSSSSSGSQFNGSPSTTRDFWPPAVCQQYQRDLRTLVCTGSVSRESTRPWGRKATYLAKSSATSSPATEPLGMNSPRATADRPWSVSEARAGGIGPGKKRTVLRSRRVGSEARTAETSCHSYWALDKGLCPWHHTDDRLNRSDQ